MRFSKPTFLALAALVCLTGSARAADSEGPAVPVQIHGDSVEYFHEKQMAVGTGNVRISYEGAELTADKITVYMDTKNAVAEGNVTLKQEGSTFKGKRGEYNFDKKIGKVEGMAAEIDPSLFGKAKTVERHPDGHYTAKQAYITTCCGDSPFYRIQASDIDIYPGKKVVAKNTVLWVNGVPILWIPVYVQPLIDMERFPVQLVPGKNAEWGAFLLSKTRYELADGPQLKSKGNVLVDYRSRRGLGLGAENFYKGPAVGRGAMRIYGIDDQNPPAGTDNNRYRGQWRHQMKLAQDTTFTMELNKLSDPTVVKDFFYDEEYERDAFPDNYVSVITSKPEYSLSFLDRERMDDFYTVVERSPEVRFDTHNRQFSNTPLYLRTEYQFSNLKKEFANSETQFDTLRFDTNHTLTYDGEIGALQVTPRVGTRQTYYTHRLDSSEDTVRGTFDPGLDLSTRFFKTYDASVKAWGLDWNQIRHVFTPTASWNYRPNPTAPRTVLAEFDEIDALDKRNFIRFNFENKLYTKEHRGPKGALVSREILRAIPFFDMNYDTHRIDNVGYDVEFRPYTWLGMESDATFDTVSRDFTTVNADVYVSLEKFKFGVGQRYLRNESSLTTAEVRWQIDPKHEIRVYERFEFQKKDSEEFEITLSKTFECVIVDFTYNHRDGDTFFVVFRLKGFPRASFGLSQTYNQPKTGLRDNRSGGSRRF